MVKLAMTKTVMKRLRETAETGRFPNGERFYKTRFVLESRGLVVWSPEHGAAVLTEAGAALAREMWPDLDVVELGNPFYGENLGIPADAIDLHRQVTVLERKIKIAWEWSEDDRKLREAQIRRFAERYLRDALGPRREGESSTLDILRCAFAPDRPDQTSCFYLDLRWEGKRDDLPTVEYAAVIRRSYVRDRVELIRFLDGFIDLVKLARSAMGAVSWVEEKPAGEGEAKGEGEGE